MNPLETLQALNLALEILSKIDTSSIEDRTKQKIREKVLDTIDEALKSPRRATGNRQKVIDALQKLGGKAYRREIVEETNLAPHIVSAFLSRLYKAKKIDKIKVEKPANRSGSGLKPEYMYVLLTVEEVSEGEL